MNFLFLEPKHNKISVSGTQLRFFLLYYIADNEVCWDLLCSLSSIRNPVKSISFFMQQQVTPLIESSLYLQLLELTIQSRGITGIIMTSLQLLMYWVYRQAQMAPRYNKCMIEGEDGANIKENNICFKETGKVIQKNLKFSVSYFWLQILLHIP